MMFKLLPVTVALLATASAYTCSTSAGKFDISDNVAAAAKTAGGTKVGKSGYPHAFGGSAGSGHHGGTGGQLKFHGANPKCNEKHPKLLEFPVFQSGKTYDKEQKHGTVGTPARVVYLDDGSTLCGGMTHVDEDKKTHAGTGPFRVCD